VEFWRPQPRPRLPAGGCGACTRRARIASKGAWWPTGRARAVAPLWMRQRMATVVMLFFGVCATLEAKIQSLAVRNARWLLGARHPSGYRTYHLIIHFCRYEKVSTAGDRERCCDSSSLM